MTYPANVADLGFAIQPAKGVPADPSDAFLMFLAGGTMVGSTGTDNPFEETTGSRTRSDRYVSERHVEGAPEFFVTPRTIGALLFAVLGDILTTGSGDPYTHLITNAMTRPWLTFWRRQSDLRIERSVDCKIDSLVLSGESGLPLRAAANVQGLSATPGDPLPPEVLPDTLDRIIYYHGEGRLKIEDAPVRSIRTFALTLPNNGELIPGDSLTPIDISEGVFEPTLSITRLAESSAMLNRKWYGSDDPAGDAKLTTEVLRLVDGVDFTFMTKAAVPGPERSLRILLPEVTVQPYDVQPDTGSTPLTEEFTLDALDNGSDPVISATVVNNVAAYDVEYP